MLEKILETIVVVCCVIVPAIVITIGIFGGMLRRFIKDWEKRL